MSDEELPVRALARFVSVEGRLELLTDRVRELTASVRSLESRAGAAERTARDALAQLEGFRAGESRTWGLTGWIVAFVALVVAACAWLWPRSQ